MPFKLNLSLLFISFLSLSTVISAKPSITTVIPILKDEVGFYVEADLGNKLNPNIGNLVLSLSNTDSFFGKNCFGFKDFDCSECHFDYYVKNYQIPPLPAIDDARYVYLLNRPSTTFWNLNRKVFAEDCLNRAEIDFKQKRSGLLGMGTLFNLVPFYYPETFSITVDKELRSGTLSYKDLPNPSRTPLFTFNVRNEKDWAVYVHPPYNLPSNYFTHTGLIIFDMNAEALGFSSINFFSTLQNITKVTGCSNPTDDLFKPKCKYSGEFEDLPPLNFEFYSGSLTIPPEVYIDKLENGVATLNIKQVSDTGKGVNFATFPKGEKLLILDAKFMSYFETVFDMSDMAQPKIKLYTLETTDTPTEAGMNPYQDQGNAGKQKFLY